MQPISIFTGAGISGALPAGLPLGNRLRNEILRHCCHCFGKVLNRVSLATDLYHLLEKENWKLEFVVGRVAGLCEPQDAFKVLSTLDIEIPNEAHMLLARHLLDGGLQATLNFDEGIERAYGLLLGDPLQAKAKPQYEPLLARWRHALGTHYHPRLEVVATELGFQRWNSTPVQPALLKLHGSIMRCPRSIEVIEPIVTDDAEMFRLSPARLAALRAIVCKQENWITGYGGFDIDVYDDLLEYLTNTKFRWVSPSFTPEIICDIGKICKKQPETGNAVELLRSLYPNLPPWPEADVRENGFEIRFQQWCRNLDPVVGAGAIAWMLIDVREYDLAANALEQLVSLHNIPRLQVRLADAYYHRAKGDDKDRAARHYLSVGRTLRIGVLGGYALARWAASARVKVINSKNQSLRMKGAISAVSRLIIAYFMAIREPNRRERLSSPLAESGHLLWRIAEVLACKKTGPAKKILLHMLSALSIACLNRTSFSSAGKQSVFARLQTIEVRCFRQYLCGLKPIQEDWKELQRIEQMYSRLPDPRGIANIAAAKALWLASNGETRAAEEQLDDSAAKYSYPNGDSDPAGMALIARRKRILQVL